jgi:hypothetical protein
MPKRVATILVAATFLLLSGISLNAEQASTAGQQFIQQPSTTIPRLVKFEGTLKDNWGQPRTGVIGLTFGVYKDQEDMTPLWLETQNVELDPQGHYTVMLGSTKLEGLPRELFSSFESRWVGVQPMLPNEREQPRVLLVSVPYALRSGDAETLGGKPLSAFLLAPTNDEVSSGSPLLSKINVKPRLAGTGNQNRVAKFVDSSGTLGNSNIYDINGTIGINTSNPRHQLDVFGSIGAINSGNQPGQGGYMLPGQGGGDGWGLRTNSSTSGFQFFIDSYFSGQWSSLLTITGDIGCCLGHYGNVGIGTNFTNPNYKLDVQGQINASGGICISGSCITSISPPEVNFIPKYTGANTVGNSQIFDDGTNVGIGTILPSRQLDVAGVIRTTVEGFRPGGIGISLGDYSLGDIWGFRRTQTRDLAVDFYDGTQWRSAMTMLNANGNVGIGTSNPQRPLEVASGDVYLSSVATGVILKSPDGTKCARISLDNTGALTTTPLTCP